MLYSTNNWKLLFSKLNIKIYTLLTDKVLTIISKVFLNLQESNIGDYNSDTTDVGHIINAGSCSN